MTKGELLKALENVPDDFDICVCTVDSTGMPYEPIVDDLEINNDIHAIYLQIIDDDSYL